MVILKPRKTMEEIQSVSGLEEKPKGAGVSIERTRTILKKAILIFIYLTAFLAPVFYLPFTQDSLFAKQVLVTTLVSVAFVLWLVRLLITRQIQYIRGWFGIAAIFLFSVFLASAIFSIHPRLSFFVPDPTGERLFSFAVFLILGMLIALEFSRHEVRRIVTLLLASGILLSLLTFFQLFQFFPLPAVLQINPVGTINNSAAVIIIFFVLAFSTILFGNRAETDRRLTKVFAWIMLVSGAVNLLAIDFKIGWIALAAISGIFIAANFARSLKTKDSADQNPTSTKKINFIILAVLIASILLAFFSIPIGRLIPNLRTEVEVAPSFGATLSIAAETLKTRPVLGSGLGTFIYDYIRFHSQNVNQTIFWNIKFNHGTSFLTTLIATAGPLGILALLVFIILVLYTIWRIFINPRIVDPLEFSLAFSACMGVTLWIIYPSTFVMNLLLFIAIGGFLALIPEEASSEPSGWKSSLWQRFEKKSFTVNTKYSAIILSIGTVAFLIATLFVAATFIRKYFAEIYFNRGVFELSQNGNTDTALVRFNSALAIDPQNDFYFINLSQVYFIRAQQIIGRLIAGDPTAQSDFQTNFNAGLEAARRSVAINPYDPTYWLNLGSLYETAMPFISGNADKFAIDFYEEASRREPANPIAHALVGRTYISIADILLLRIRQGAVDAKVAEPAAKDAITKAKEHLNKAIELKSDYAAAQFFLAQAFSREGNIDEAILRGTEAALGAPQDIGVAFFLGILYYQKDRLTEAGAEFSRAIALNQNYSNARYFLGLVYDRLGRRQDALEQFRRIYELNPDNEEVRQIIISLEAGKTALEVISPPPPEQRKEPPVKETRTQQRKPQTRTRR